MDEFEALLAAKPAAPAAKSAESAEPADEFAALLSKAPAVTKAKKASEPAPASGPVRDFVAGAADLFDLVAGGIPAMALGTAGDVINRVSGLVDGRSRKEVAETGARISSTVGEKIGTPARSFLESRGYLAKDNKSTVGRAVEGFTSLLERDANSIEERTGGRVLKEDYLMLVNGAMAALGVKGVSATAKLGIDAAKAKQMASDLRDSVNKQQAENAIADEAAAPARQAAADLEGLAIERQVRSVVRPNERTPSAPVESAELRDLREQAARYSQVKGAGATGAVPPELSARIAELELAHVRAGQKAKASMPGGPAATAAAVGGTGLGLAMLMGADDEEKQLAIGGGALIAGAGLARGGHLTLDALRTMPDASPLGAILDKSAYSLNTLEMLPKNRFEFTKSSISELLKRQEVTKAERDILQGVLDSKPGETITAKELMAGVKEKTGDFELKPVKSDTFADYGLANLDRVERSTGNWQDWIPEDATPEEAARIEAEGRVTEAAAPVATTTIYQSPVRLGDNNHFGDPNYFAHTRSFMEKDVKHVVELQSDYAQKVGKTFTPEEKATAVAEYEKLDAKRALYAELMDDVGSGASRKTLETMRGLPEFKEAFDRGENNPGHMLKRADLGLQVRAQELLAKIKSSEGVERITPMLKNWHKRLVREELASAAREGQPVVRFASADTVAKVEGWPRLNADGVNVELARQLGVNDPAALTGETRFSPAHQGIYDRYANDVTKFLKQLGGKEITDSAGHTWIEVPVEGSSKVRAGNRVLQFGQTDPALMASIAVAGAGAATVAYLSSPENKAKNAALTAAVIGLAALAKSRSPAIAEIAQQAGRLIEGTLGNLSAEMRTISEPVLRRLTDHSWQELVQTQNYTRRIAPLVDAMRTAPRELQAKINAAALSGSREDLVRALAQIKADNVIKMWDDARKVLQELGGDLVKTGRLKGLVADYYPRMVNDLPGLLKYLGKEEASSLQKAIADAEAKSIRETGQGLSQLETSIVTNKHIETMMRGGTGRPSFLKMRTLKQVTEEMAPFYAPASESLPLYVRAAVREIERAKFFGKDLVRSADGSISINDSIGNIANKELAAGKMTVEQYQRMIELLSSRFGPGERSSNRFVQTFRNVGYTALLGNAVSAIQNLADMGATVAMHGFVPTAKAAAGMIRQDAGRITASDLGLAKHLGEEFVGGSRKPVTVLGKQLSTARFLEQTFKWSGFSLLDGVMKETKANAVISQYERLARTERGQQRIAKQYRDYFGADLPQLLADLQGGAKTPLTIELAFRELSDAQPLTRIEVPKFYLDHPNLRPAWMLKTFTIKQLNLVRERGFREIAKGNVKEGTEFLLRYSIMLGVAGATTSFISDALLGRDSKLDWGSIPDNALKTFGWSRFVTDKFRQGKPGEAVASVVTPPFKVFWDIMQGKPEAVRYIPWIGRITYDRFMGGSEKANENARKREEKEARDGTR